jgi:NSS family neurotransmitter:Na+ symporter
MFIAALTVMGGVATIEPVNKVMVPTLLLIVTLSFYWSIFLPDATDGITYMFRPNWSKRD